jgi:hypothetical protein
MTRKTNRRFIIAGVLWFLSIFLLPLIGVLLDRLGSKNTLIQFCGDNLGLFIIPAFGLIVGLGIMPRLWTTHFSKEYKPFAGLGYDPLPQLRAENRFRSLGLLIDDPIVKKKG